MLVRDLWRLDWGSEHWVRLTSIGFKVGPVFPWRDESLARLVVKLVATGRLEIKTTDRMTGEILTLPRFLFSLARAPELLFLDPEDQAEAGVPVEFERYLGAELFVESARTFALAQASARIAKAARRKPSMAELTTHAGITPEQFDPQREVLIKHVFSGRLTPEQAEDKARSIGLGRLSQEPPSDTCNPMWDASWTVTMVIAWITKRSLQEVRRSSPRYNREYKSWRPRHVGADLGTCGVSPGYLLEFGASGSSLVALQEKASRGAIEATPAELNAARTELWELLSTGQLTAVHAGVAVPKEHWLQMQHDETDLIRSDVFFVGNGVPAHSRIEYFGPISISRLDVLSRWPDPKSRKQRPGETDKAWLARVFPDEVRPTIKQLRELAQENFGPKVDEARVEEKTQSLRTTSYTSHPNQKKTRKR
jgi:hypothetical protein